MRRIPQLVRRSPAKRAEGGSAFTLIELIVVVAILSLVVAVAYPKLSGGLLASERLRNSVTALAAVASYARDQAVATRRMQVLSLDLKSGAYSVASAPAPVLPGSPQSATGEAESEPGGDAATPGTDSVLRGSLPEGVAFENVHLTGKAAQPEKIANLRFTPEGWADPAVIRVRGSGGEIQSIVITAPAGRIETYPSAVSEDGSAVANP